MTRIHGSIVAAALVLMSAGSVSAQTAAAPDSAKIVKLSTVTITESGNWLTRADDLRRSVLDAVAENRRLVSVLREQDIHVARLTLRLDSLKRVEFVQTIAIAAIDDSVSATRARRRALEARVVALETRRQQP